MEKAKKKAHESFVLVYVKDRKAWRKWLIKNHTKCVGAWLIFDKKGKNEQRLPYADAVEEALCFGWIDGLVHGIDEHQYKQMFTPRKAKSVWSAINKKRVAKLIAEGTMMEAGLAMIAIAKKNGQWTALDAIEALKPTPEFARALEKNKKAKAFYDSLAMSNRKGYLYWIGGAKRPETQAARIKHAIALLARGIRSRHEA